MSHRSHPQQHHFGTVAGLNTTDRGLQGPLGGGRPPKACFPSWRHRSPRPYLWTSTRLRFATDPLRSDYGSRRSTVLRCSRLEVAVVLTWVLLRLAYAGLGPDDVVVAFNRDDPDAVETARHYTCARDLPHAQLCGLAGRFRARRPRSWRQHSPSGGTAVYLRSSPSTMCRATPTSTPSRPRGTRS